MFKGKLRNLPFNTEVLNCGVEVQIQALQSWLLTIELYQ
jgi:hypothetical protein